MSEVNRREFLLSASAVVAGARVQPAASASLKFSGLCAVAYDKSTLTIGLMKHPNHKTLVLFKKSDVQSGATGLVTANGDHWRVLNPDAPGPYSQYWCVEDPKGLSIATDGVFGVGNVALCPAHRVETFSRAKLSSESTDVLVFGNGSWQSATRPKGSCAHVDADWTLVTGTQTSGPYKIHDLLVGSGLGALALTMNGKSVVMKPGSTVWIGRHPLVEPCGDPKESRHVEHYFKVCQNGAKSWYLKRPTLPAACNCGGFTTDPIFCPPALMAL